MEFRRDINALRAIAVISVVLFHFNENWLPGGFAGVDIFFVISGFLMTKIIIGKHKQNNFVISQFYLARANRIIPPLAVLCLSLIIFGWFLFTPVEYSTLGLHISSSLTFISNFVFWKESGYFEAGSHEKWLLHTWSLSLEWQFYILYPIALFILLKFTSLAKLRTLVFLATLLSLFLSLWATNIWPTPSYYLLPTRAWELLVGALAFFYPLAIQKYQKTVVCFGLALLMLSFCTLNKHTQWPSTFTLLPVFATFLIIQARATNYIVFNNIIFQKLGSWSYSIYLWHWPITVTIFTFSLGTNSVYFGVLLSVLFGYLSYHFVEQAKCNNKRTTSNKPYIKSMTLVFSAAGLGYLIHFSDGVNSPFRSISTTDEAQYLTYYHRDNYRKIQKESYTFEKSLQSGKGGIFIWGDSHAAALSYGIRKSFPTTNINQSTTPGCRPLLNEDSKTTGSVKKKCDAANKKALRAILHVKPNVILLAQRRFHDENNYEDILNYLRGHDLKTQIILVGPVPQWQPSLPNTIVKRHFTPEERMFNDPSFVSELFTVNNKLKRDYDKSEILHISILDNLCESDKCLAKVDNKNTPLVWDYGHLSIEGSLFVVNNILKKEITRFL